MLGVSVQTEEMEKLQSERKILQELQYEMEERRKVQKLREKAGQNSNLRK